MTLIRLRGELYKPVDIKKIFKVSDSEFRLFYSWRKFNELLKQAGFTEKTIKQYDSAIADFLLFLELINISINDVKDSDLELYKQLLLRRNNNHNKRTVKTKITRVIIYLQVYFKINKNMLGDYSTKGVINQLKQLEAERQEEER